MAISLTAILSGGCWVATLMLFLRLLLNPLFPFRFFGPFPNLPFNKRFGNSLRGTSDVAFERIAARKEKRPHIMAATFHALASDGPFSRLYRRRFPGFNTQKKALDQIYICNHMYFFVFEICDFCISVERTSTHSLKTFPTTTRRLFQPKCFIFPPSTPVLLSDITMASATKGYRNFAFS